MKKFNYIEKRIYIAEITFNHKKHHAFDVHEALQASHPEYEGTSYEYEYKDKNTGVVRVYKNSVYEFVED